MDAAARHRPCDVCVSKTGQLPEPAPLPLRGHLRSSNSESIEGQRGRIPSAAVAEAGALAVVVDQPPRAPVGGGNKDQVHGPSGYPPPGHRQPVRAAAAAVEGAADLLPLPLVAEDEHDAALGTGIDRDHRRGFTRRQRSGAGFEHRARRIADALPERVTVDVAALVAMSVHCSFKTTLDMVCPIRMPGARSG